MRIAIDAMGGDHAPDAIIKGSLDALDLLNEGDQIVLVGDRAIIEEHIHERGISDARLDIHHAADQIAMDESPVDAVRSKPDSSIVQAMQLGSKRHSDNPVDVVISAGNTGACVSAATMYMRRLPGVHRPGIATAIPTFHGPVIVCDVGANPEPRDTHLAQYAVMAEIYAKKVLRIASPRVALLNIGSEEAKGTGMVKAVRDMIRDIHDLNYTGFIEGREVFEGGADVIVTDGFVGNTMLKLAEGFAKSLFKAIAHEVFEADPDLAMRLQPVVESLMKKNDYHEYGGAPLLGVNGGCIICHGSSEARTIRAAVRAAREYVAAGVNDAIVERVTAIDEHASSVEAASA